MDRNGGRPRPRSSNGDHTGLGILRDRSGDCGLHGHYGFPSRPLTLLSRALEQRARWPFPPEIINAPATSVSANRRIIFGECRIFNSESSPDYFS